MEAAREIIILVGKLSSRVQASENHKKNDSIKEHARQAQGGQPGHDQNRCSQKDPFQHPVSVMCPCASIAQRAGRTMTKRPAKERKKDKGRNRVT